MVQSKTILFADNNAYFLDARAEYLDDAYTILKASSPAEARVLMETRRIHLAILDIRMENDDDDNDISGIELAKEELFLRVPTIILSSYGTREQIVEMMAPALEGLPAAVDFVDKKAHADQMVSAVERAFERHVRLNWDLDIHFGHHLFGTQLATLVAEPNDHFLIDRSREIEDLLRICFADSSQINVPRILTRENCIVVLEVAVFDQTEIERQYMITLGKLDSIQAEQECYNQYAPRYGGAGDTLRMGDQLIHTAHLGLVVYNLTGNEGKWIDPFAVIFQNSSLEKIAQAIDNLYQTTLKRWQSNGRFEEPTQSIVHTYCDHLGLDYENLPHASPKWISALKVEIQRTGLGRLTWEADRITLVIDKMEWKWLNIIGAKSADLIQGEYTLESGIIHGNVTVDTVLVNPSMEAWLIDFSHARQGPLVLDFISLELSLRYQMANNVDLATSIKIEENLLHRMAHPNKTAELHELSAVAQKELEIIRHIREQAVEMIGQDQTSYLAGVYCYALHLWQGFENNRHYARQELMPLLHMFIVMTVTLEYLVQSQAAQRDPLILDTNDQSVRIGDRAIELTPQEFDILAYLHKHAGQLRTREQILTEAMDTPEMDEQLNLSRFNSAMSRLRQKVEADTRNPQYIFNVRGRGYRMDL